MQAFGVVMRRMQTRKHTHTRIPRPTRCRYRSFRIAETWSPYPKSTTLSTQRQGPVWSAITPPSAKWDGPRKLATKRMVSIVRVNPCVSNSVKIMSSIQQLSLTSRIRIVIQTFASNVYSYYLRSIRPVPTSPYRKFL